MAGCATCACLLSPLSAAGSLDTKPSEEMKTLSPECSTHGWSGGRYLPQVASARRTVRACFAASSAAAASTEPTTSSPTSAFARERSASAGMSALSFVSSSACEAAISFAIGLPDAAHSTALNKRLRGADRCSKCAVTRAGASSTSLAPHSTLRVAASSSPEASISLCTAPSTTDRLTVSLPSPTMLSTAPATLPWAAMRAAVACFTSLLAATRSSFGFLAMIGSKTVPENARRSRVRSAAHCVKNPASASGEHSAVHCSKWSARSCTLYQTLQL